MENLQQQPEDQPDGDAEGLANAIAGLRMVLRPLIRNPADLEDVLQNKCVRLVQASRTDGGVRCPQAFLRSVWREELAMVCRERARRQESGEAGEPQPDELACSAKSEGWSEEQIVMVGAALPGVLRAWFADRVSGRSDAELAARDDVTEAAIRRRWMQLRAHFENEGVLEKILDFVITNRGSPASIQLEPPVAGGPPPNPPTPQPDLIRAQAKTGKFAWCSCQFESEMVPT